MEQENTQSHAAKFAFFYMLSLVALVFMALSTGMMIFQIINKYIVDVLEPFSGRFSDSALKFAISAIIISTPIFYVLTHQIQKNLKSGALNKDSGVRRWLTYFILLIASVVMIGWLIGTLNAFFEGELTLKFALKALTAVGISATIFTFYLFDIRRQAVENTNLLKIYFYGSLTVVVAAFVWSIFLVESPAEARNRRFDQLIISDFSQIDNAINTYYNDKGEMPASLNALKDEINYITNKEIEDPVNNKPYDYKLTGEKEYELCASFRTSNQDDEEELEYRYIDKQWLHGVGEQCLKQKIRSNPKDIIEPRPIIVD